MREVRGSKQSNIFHQVEVRNALDRMIANTSEENPRDAIGATVGSEHILTVCKVRVHQAVTMDTQPACTGRSRARGSPLYGPLLTR